LRQHLGLQLARCIPCPLPARGHVHEKTRRPCAAAADICLRNSSSLEP
jgi:hypothetical protein